MDMIALRRKGSLAIAAGLAFALPAWADGYSKPPLRVMAAGAVINVPAARQPPYKMGDRLYLMRQNKLPTAAAADLTQTGFELRLFRIENADADPAPWHQDQDHCDIFLTLVFKHLKFRGDRVEIGPMDSRHWLTQTSEGFVAPGHYLLVIEQDSAPDAASEVNHWEVFRLASALRAQYFNQGVRIEIDPPEGHDGPLTGPDEDTLMKQALDLVARTVASKFNCYQTKPVSTAANGAAQVALASCAADPALPGS